MKSDRLRGTIPALVTPIKDDGNRVMGPINEKEMERLVYYTLDGGCEGVLGAGCTGHAASLTIDEQVNLIKLVREITDDYNAKNGTSKLVLGGDGSNSTHESIDFAQRVEKEAGVLYHLMISPYTNKPSQRGIGAHFEEVAKNIDGDIIVYSVPGRTGGAGILSETAEQLAYDPRIIGIKEASGDPERIKDTIARTRDLDFVVLSGDDGLNIDIIEWGGKGSISVAGNIAPGKTSDSVRYALGGDFESARNVDGQLRGLYKALFLADDGNPVMVHYGLRRAGYNVGVPRLPLVDANEENKREMDKVLIDLGFDLKQQ